MTTACDAKEGVKRGPGQEQVRDIVNVMQSGGSVPMAAAAAGVSPHRVEAWLRLGEAVLDAGAPPKQQNAAQKACAKLVIEVRRHAALAEAACLEAVHRAAVEGEVYEETTRVVDSEKGVTKETTVIKKSPPQWKAAQWWLEQAQRRQAATTEAAPVAPIINYRLDPECTLEDGHSE